MINNNNKKNDIDYLDDLIIYFSRLREKEKENKNKGIDSFTLYRKYLYSDNIFRSKL